MTPVLTRARLLELRELVRQVPVARPIQDYAVRLVLSTHPKGRALGGTGLQTRASDGEFATPLVTKFVRVGASPRAAQALVLGAKCRALLDGRPAVSIDDLKEVALGALRHRLILNFEAEAEGVTADIVVENAMATVPVTAS